MKRRNIVLFALLLAMALVTYTQVWTVNPITQESRVGIAGYKVAVVRHAKGKLSAPGDGRRRGVPDLRALE